MAFFILAGRRARRIITRSDYGFMTVRGGPVRIAAVQSNASDRQRGAAFIARAASARDELGATTQT